MSDQQMISVICTIGWCALGVSATCIVAALVSDLWRRIR